MKIGEIWKAKGHTGRVKILDIETGTITPRDDERYDKNLQYIKFKVLDASYIYEDGCNREDFVRIFEKVYE